MHGPHCSIGLPKYACIHKITRWYTWSYNPYKWPYKWATGLFTPCISGVTNLLKFGGGPSCIHELSWIFVWYLIWFWHVLVYLTHSWLSSKNIVFWTSSGLPPISLPKRHIYLIFILGEPPQMASSFSHHFHRFFQIFCSSYISQLIINPKTIFRYHKKARVCI